MAGSGDGSGSFEGSVALISGGSRGIGLEIVKRLAEQSASIVLVAKTAEAHPKLEGTIFSAAEEIEALGGGCLPIVGDIRDERLVAGAVAQGVERFGGIDICINNASAIDLRGVDELPVKRFDLMQSVNARGTFVVTQACLPHLRRSKAGHVLTLSPPINTDPRWFQSSAYAISKYGMTIVTRGLAEQMRGQGVAANCLWPRTAIATAAVTNLLGGVDVVAASRTPRIVADAAEVILRRPPHDCSGNAFLVEDVLAEEGIQDLGDYAQVPGTEHFVPDFFLDFDDALLAASRVET